MFKLSSLPYDYGALEPYISARTMELHHAKHHQAYVDNLNKLLAGSDLADKSLEEIIRQTSGRADQAAIFNNAAQHHNHEFFWQCLSPASAGKAPDGNLEAALARSFGSLDGFYQEFQAAALGQFGSGWVWLVKGERGLEIVKLSNAGTPAATAQSAVFGLDVWEHAYYLDYQNRRGDYVAAVLKNIVNWDFVAKNL